MGFRGLIAALLAAAGLVLLAPGTASAEDPVDLRGTYVLDQAGALGGDVGAVEEALDDLFDRTGAQLFVVLVNSFTGAADDQAWADETAILSGLGESDALLAIAVDDRVYRYSVATAFPLTNDQLDQIAEDRLIPALRDDRWADGITAFADGVGDQLAGGGGIPILPVLGGAAVLGVGAFAVSRIVKRRRGGTAAPAGTVDQKELDRRSGSLLVRLDDALKTSEQELGFAVAQFGEKSTAEFAAALGTAQEQVKKAFALRQKLDDGTPETDAERREMTEQIIELCESADRGLDDQAAAFEQLRQLETNAPKVIESVAAEHAGIGDRISTGATTLADLEKRFGESGVASVAGNIDQARKLQAFAGDALEQGRRDLAGGDASAAAVSVRGAQQAVGQIGQLLAAIEKLAVDLPAVKERLDAAVDDTRADLAEARGATASPALTAAITEAERVLAESTTRDPAAALPAIDAANATLNQALSAVRDAEAQAARAAAQLGRVTDGARATISAAHDYIATRRGGVGSAARTRLAEAERLLTQALAQTASDPVAALTAAQQAQTLGAAALDLAHSDVASFSAPSSGPVGGGSGGSGGFGGAVLGGILGGLLSSGGGSTPFGGGGGFGGAGGSRPRPRPSTGGSRPRRPSSSRSGRRGGGGRF